MKFAGKPGNLLQKVRAIGGVGCTLTTVVLQTHLERGVQVP